MSQLEPESDQIPYKIYKYDQYNQLEPAGNW